MSTTVTDAAGHVWTLGPNGETLRDNVQFAGGLGDDYALSDLPTADTVWTRGKFDGLAYWENGSGWVPDAAQAWPPPSAAPPVVVPPIPGLSFTFVVIATILPGGGGIPDQTGKALAVALDGTLTASGVKIGVVGKVVIWRPADPAGGTPTGAVFAPGKTDGKWWEWNGAKWVVIDPLRALPGLLV